MDDLDYQQNAKWAGHGTGWVELEAIYLTLKEREGVKLLHRLLMHVVICYRGRTGLMNQSLAALAERTGASVRSVQRALSDLRAWRLLDWKLGGIRGANKLSNHYRLGAALIEQMNKLGSSVGQSNRSSVGHPGGQRSKDFEAITRSKDSLASHEKQNLRCPLHNNSPLRWEEGKWRCSQRRCETADRMNRELLDSPEKKQNNTAANGANGSADSARERMLVN